MDPKGLIRVFTGECRKLAGSCLWALLLSFSFASHSIAQSSCESVLLKNVQKTNLTIELSHQEKQNLRALLHDFTSRTKELVRNFSDSKNNRIAADLISQKVFTYLKNLGVEVELLPSYDSTDTRMVRIRTISGDDGSPAHAFNRVAHGVFKRFGYTLDFDPYVMAKQKSAGWCLPERKQLGLSLEHVRFLTPDATFLHEIRHVFLSHLNEQTLSRAQGETLMSGEVRSLGDTRLPVTYEVYQDFYRIDEVFSHLVTLQMNSKSLQDLYENQEGALRKLRLLQAEYETLHLTLQNLKYQAASESSQGAGQFLQWMQPGATPTHLESAIENYTTRLSQLKAQHAGEKKRLQILKEKIRSEEFRAFQVDNLSLKLIKEISGHLAQFGKLAQTKENALWTVGQPNVAVNRDKNTWQLQLFVSNPNQSLDFGLAVNLDKSNPDKKTLKYRFSIHNYNRRFKLKKFHHIIEIQVADPQVVRSFERQIELMEQSPWASILENVPILQSRFQIEGQPAQTLSLFQPAITKARELLRAMQNMGEATTTHVTALEKALNQKDLPEFQTQLMRLRAQLIEYYYPRQH